MKKRGISIAIDGPAASGKSTTAKILAQKLGLLHIDTGAMYRALTLKALEKNIDITNEDALVELARQCTITFGTDGTENRVYVNGEEVTKAIREPEVTRNVSAVSSFPRVRQVMVELQRQLAKDGGVVLDGRDIGTVVLPDAEVKIFLIADVGERAKRRKKDLERVGVNAEEHELEQEILERDRKDSTRAASPLKQANDALVIDTTHLTIDEQVEKILQYAQQKMKTAT